MLSKKSHKVNEYRDYYAFLNYKLQEEVRRVIPEIMIKDVQSIGLFGEHEIKNRNHMKNDWEAFISKIEELFYNNLPK